MILVGAPVGVPIPKLLLVNYISVRYKKGLEGNPGDTSNASEYFATRSPSKPFHFEVSLSMC